MFKRICLLGIASFFIAGLLLATLSALLGPNALAQEGSAPLVDPRLRGYFFREQPEVVNLPDIEDLNSLNLDFGATQNSLVLELVGSSGTNKINFTLAETGKKAEVPANKLNDWRAWIGHDKKFIDKISLTYVADFQPNFVYQLKEDLPQADLSRPSFCGQRLKIIVFPGEDNYDEVNGYSQNWRKFDLNDKSLKAAIGLPFLNGTTDNAGDDCFYLYEELDFKGSDNKPFFALIGNQTFQNSCADLKLYGRGEDDLSKAATTWFCRDDISLEGEEEDKFSIVESPPFDNYYIFIEGERKNPDYCSSRILVNKTDIEEDKLTLTGEWQDWHDDCKEGQYDKEKDQKRTVPITLINTFKTDEDAAALNPGDTGDTSVANVSNIENTCEFQASGVILGWLFCWVIQGISEALDGMESLIYEHLTIKRSDYYLEKFQDHGKEFTLKDAWANIRNFMTFTIVGTALFMVISTALDIGFFSNYTVKKYLPRLIIGTILIQFSWALGDLLIQITNQLGDFVSALLFASFPGAEDHGLDDIFGSGGFAALLGGGGVLGLTVNAGWLVLIPTGFSALVMLFLGFLFLVFRKYMIIFMLILAPLGLALWILPGNDKAWNFYAKTFFYLLLIYPLIQLTITGGKVFSYLIIKTDDSVIATFVAFLIYALGFAAIPVLAKSFSGVLGKLTGMVNDKSKGIFDRRRKGLEEMVKSRREARKLGKKEARNQRFAEGANKPRQEARQKKLRRAGRRWKDSLSRSRDLYGADVPITARGRRNPRPSRQAAMDRYNAEQKKQHQERVTHAQSELAVGDATALSAIALNKDEAPHRREAALRNMAKNKKGIDGLRDVFAAAQADPNDTGLHSSLQGAYASGALTEKHVLELAPDYDSIGFDQNGRFTGPESGYLRNLGEGTLADMSERSWREYLGIQPGATVTSADAARIAANPKMKKSTTVVSSVEPLRGKMNTNALDLLADIDKLKPQTQEEGEQQMIDDASKAREEERYIREELLPEDTDIDDSDY